MIHLTCLSFPELKILTTKIKIKTRIKEVHYKVWFVVLKIKFGFSLQNSFFLTHPLHLLAYLSRPPMPPASVCPWSFLSFPHINLRSFTTFSIFLLALKTFPAIFYYISPSQLPLNPRPPSIVFHSLSQNFLKSPFPFFFPCQAFLRPVSPCTLTSFRLSPCRPFSQTFLPPSFIPFPCASDLSFPLLQICPPCLRPFPPCLSPPTLP